MDYFCCKCSLHSSSGVCCVLVKHMIDQLGHIQLGFVFVCTCWLLMCVIACGGQKPDTRSKAKDGATKKLSNCWPVTSYPSNMCRVVIQLPMQAALSLGGKVMDLWQVAAPQQYALKTLIIVCCYFPVKFLHSADLYKPYICHVRVFMCYMLKAMSQWEWESIHAACYQWAVLLSAGTVWLQQHFKEPVRRRSKPVKWDMRSQRAALQQLNDVEASSSVRQ